MGSSASKKHSIGKTIAELRKAKGWTQNELAEKLQVSDKAISKWEKDSGAPSIEFFPALAKLFGVTIDYLMIGKQAAFEDIAISKIEPCANSIYQEKAIQLCVQNGIIYLDGLITFNNFALYEEMLKKYPASIYEKIFLDIENKRYKDLFKYALEHNDTNIIQSLSTKKEEKLKEDFERSIRVQDLKNEINSRYISLFIGDEHTISLYFGESPNWKCKPTFENFIKAKNYLFLLEVLDKDIKFIERACSFATQQQLDEALTKISPNNFKGIYVLLNAGAKLHKTWREDDGWGYMVDRDEIDEISTEILKAKIKDILGE